MRPNHRLTALVACAALVATAVVPTIASAEPSPPTTTAATTSATTDSLLETGPDQQRWLSVPESRVVLNPYNFNSSGSELSLNSGNDLPLSNGYYAHDRAIRTADVLTTFVSGAEPPQTLLDEGFDSAESTTANGWSTSSVDAAYADGQVTISNSAGANWGNLSSPDLTLDPGVHSQLTVTVSATSPAGVGKWAIKLLKPGTPDDFATIQDDTTETGTFTYDLGRILAEEGETGAQQVRLRLWTSNYQTGEQTVSATFDSISISQPPADSFPDTSQLVAWSNDFDSASGWTGNGTASLSTTGGLGTVTLASNEWGNVAAQATSINLDRTPILSLSTPSGTGEWAVKVTDGGEDITLQDDTTANGMFSYNIASATGWSGTRTFTIRLFQIGAGESNTSRQYDRISIHSGSSGTAASSAQNVAYSWTPAALRMTGTYDNGTIETSEYFTPTDPDAYIRFIDPTTDANVIVAGAFEGSGTTYNATNNVITIRGQYATRSIALPEGSTAQFYSSKSAMIADQSPSATPQGNNGYWAAVVPGDEVSVVGVGWAVNAGTFDYPDVNYQADQVAQSTASALLAANPATAVDALTYQEQWWDTYLASVPLVEDFSIQRVADGGVTADEMEHFYYKAWIGLEMNVLPATPETGNLHTQVGTGKPSMWMSGTPRTKNVASWDSLLGMQQLVYTDPANAWDSFIGMIKQVQLDGQDPTDTNALDAKGALGGESLPSRKAQTAWILYQVTGDTEKLESVYDALRLNLIWSTHNMRWIYGSNNYTDERDSEFVASIIYDLKFGQKIADELGHPDDAAHFTQLITDLTRDYEAWFFPTTWTTDQDGQDVQWSTVQKIYLDRLEGGSGCPWSDDSEGADYYNSAGQCVKAGWSFYTTTAMVAHELGDTYKTKVMERFMRDYDDTEQLAGLGHFAVKAPDMQLITYGFLDDAGWADYPREDLIDYATVIVNSFNRDMVKSGWFAEVYESTGDHKAGGTPKARGVRPSLFGISNYLDNIFIANGLRIDEGEPGIVRLEGATGGIQGLTFMGEKYNLDLQGTTAQLSGDAVELGLLPASVDVNQPGVTAFVERGELSNDTTLSAITVGGAPLAGFNAATRQYAVELPAGTTSVPAVTATATNGFATAVVTAAAALPGTTTITVTAANGATGSYTINFTVAADTTDPDPVASTVTLPGRVTSTYGSAATVAVTVNAVGKTPVGRVELRAGQTSLGQAAVAAGRATVALPANLKVGTHTVEAVFVPAVNSGVAGASAATSIVISKAQSTLKNAKVTKPKKSKKRIKRGKKATVKVVLTTPSTVKMAGRVTLKARKKTLGKAKLKVNKAGRYVAKIKIGKKKTRSIKRKTVVVKAIYAGNKNYAKKTFKTPIKVRR